MIGGPCFIFPDVVGHAVYLLLFLSSCCKHDLFGSWVKDVETASSLTCTQLDQLNGAITGVQRILRKAELPTAISRSGHRGDGFYSSEVSAAVPRYFAVWDAEKLDFD